MAKRRTREMMRSRRRVLGRALTALAVSWVMAAPAALASITNGTIDPAFKYAWGSRIGWINFGTSGGNVHVTNTGLTGYAWSANYGWINLAPATAGVTVDSLGNLSGNAWGENTGWILFSGSKINNDGEFFGYATGDVVGTISFNCGNDNICSSSDFKVKTDWRPPGVRPACSNGVDDDNDGKIDFPTDTGCTGTDDNDELGGPTGGGGAPGVLTPPRAPGGGSASNVPGGFQLLINGGTPVSRERHVTLTMIGGPDTAKMAVSNLSDLRDAAQVVFQPSLQWDLCGLANGAIVLSSCPEGIYTVYARFYTKTGQASPLVSSSIRLQYAPPPAPAPVITPSPYPLPSSADASAGRPPGERGPGERLEPGAPPAQPPRSIFERIPDLFERIIPRFLLPQPRHVAPIEVPLEQLVPPEAPLALRGKWDIVGGHALERFVRTPLPGTNVLSRRWEILPGAPALDAIAKPPLPAAFAQRWNLMPEAPVARFVFAPLSGKLAFARPWEILAGTPAFNVIVQPPPPAALARRWDLLPGAPLFDAIAKPPTPPALAGGWEALPGVPLLALIAPPPTPAALAGGWNLLPEKPLERFVLAPLPKEIAALAKQFPQLATTFQAVGIQRVSDATRLKTVKLTLPGLTEAAGIAPQLVRSGTLVKPRAVPLAELPVEAKQHVPAEAIFARTGGGTIDLNISLTITDQGAIRRQISTVAGSDLRLIVKPSRPAIRVRGLVVFKSRGVKPMPPKALQDHPWMAAVGELIVGRPVQAQTPPPTVQREDWLVLMEFDFIDPDGDGFYTADMETPAVEGEYEIITLIDYKDPELGTKEIRLVSVIDPEGYVFEQFGDKEARIPGTIVTLQWLDPETTAYVPWPAEEFHQENPQVTDATGKYAFLVPAGTYALEVEAPGYLTYAGRPFSVREGSGVHLNLELKSRYWYLKVVDWKTVLLALTLVLLGYNFYRDKLRERRQRG